MTLEFDLDNIDVVEFGVGYYVGEIEEFALVPVGPDVQNALKEMVTATITAIDGLNEDPAEFEPSEKYDSLAYIRIPLNHEFSEQVNSLYVAENLDINADALRDPSNVYCYFARMRDASGRRLVALRRSIQFKGLLKSRVVRILTDAMHLVDEPLFKLDGDFDMIVDQSNVHILRPNAFEKIGKLEAAILQAVATNIAIVQADLPFVDFTLIQDYVSGHARAARNLAALRTNEKTKNIDKDALTSMCLSTGVPIKEINGLISVESDNVIGFLEVLDRRRYQVRLVADAPEPYKASSRKRIS